MFANVHGLPIQKTLVALKTFSSKISVDSVPIDKFILQYNASIYHPEELSKINIYDYYPLPKMDIKHNGKGLIPVLKSFESYTYYHAIEVYELLKKIWEDQDFLEELWNECNSGVEVSDNECATLMLTCYLNDERTLLWKYYKPSLKFSLKDRIKYLKHLHTYVRLTDQLPDEGYIGIDRAKLLQYMNCIPGRQIYHKEQDVYDDLHNRIIEPKDKQWIVINKDGTISGNTSYYYKMFKNIMQDELDQIIGHKVIDSIELFDEWWARRNEHVPSGSAAGSNYKGIRLSKRTALELGYVTKEQIIEAKPGMLSTESPKFEHGKQRCLYSVDIIAHLIESYILDQLEKGYKNTPHLVTRQNMQQMLIGELNRMQTSKRNKNTMMWDYADFNLLHDIKCLKLMWTVIAEIIKYKSKLDDKHSIYYFINWMKETEASIKCFTSDNKFNSYITRGMLTGRRGTDFINTLFNRVYYRIAIKNLETIINEKNILHVSYHKGDDVYSSFKKRFHAICIPYVLNLQGLQGQFTKITPRGEFLRIMYDNVGHSGGYLNRAIPNLVSRDHNRTERDDPISRGDSLIVQCRKLVSRGANKVHISHFVYHTICNQCVLYKEEKIQQIPIQWFVSSTIYNGKGVAWFDNELQAYGLNKTRLNKIKASDFINEPKNKIMTDDYIEYLNKKYSITGYDNRIRNAFKEDNMQSIITNSAISEQRVKQFDELQNLIVYEVSSIYRDEPLVNQIVYGLISEMQKWIEIPNLINKKSGIISNLRTMLIDIGIKRKDIFLILFENQCKVLNSKLEALIMIFKELDVSIDFYQIVNSAVELLGTTLFWQLVFDEITFDNYLEGYVRDSFLVVVREIFLDKWIYLTTAKKIHLNIYLFMSLCEHKFTSILTNIDLWNQFKQ